MNHSQSQGIDEKTQDAPVQISFPTAPHLMDLDAGVVGWESASDPENPLNFSRRQKWLITGILSGLGFMTAFASSIIAPSLLFIQRDFDVEGLTLTSLPVSIFLLGYAVGPLFLSPLSEIYGRYIVMNASSTFFCLSTIGCALAPSLEALIVFRFLCGVGGSASQTIGAAIIADLFPVQERGRALGTWILGPILGPSVAPLIGAFVSEKVGWRWTSWITLVPSVVVVGAMLLLYKETNRQVLMERKTVRLRAELDRPDLRSCFIKADETRSTTLDVLRQGLFRPIKMLFGSALIFGISLYVAFVYGCLYLLFNTIPMVFRETYGWSIGVTGTVYLALLIGYIIGLAVFYLMSDRLIIRMTRNNNNIYEPEMRLPVCVYLSFMVPVSFFWYGWSSQAATPWIVPILGLIVFGIGFESVWLPTQAYVVDAYPQYSASALAACSVMRSVVAAFLPLAGPGMYETLGIGMGNTVLGLIATALVPVPLLAYKYGKSIRERERWVF